MFSMKKFLRNYSKVSFVVLLFLLYHNYKLVIYQVLSTVNAKLIMNQSVFYSSFYSEHSGRPKSEVYVEAASKTKRNRSRIILVWDDYYGIKNWGFSFIPRKDFEARKCEVTNCLVTDNKEKISEADAVMFVGDHLGKTERPEIKPPHQRWVFHENEAPCGPWIKYLHKWDVDFNWTQTYRLDSDIPMVYGTYCKREKPISLDVRKLLKPGRKFGVWFVSNCLYKSERRYYIMELMKYIPIDVFGTCSFMYNQSNVCRKNETSKCSKLIDNYKFYFSFENSLAKDYITEKYFKILNKNVIPVVRGDGNYSKLGPPDSFINTRDYKSPKDLAKYLKYLDTHDGEYVKYFKWKELYKVGSDRLCWKIEPAWCKLCRKLNNPDEPMSQYKNITKWFGTCRKADDIDRNIIFFRKPKKTKPTKKSTGTQRSSSKYTQKS